MGEPPAKKIKLDEKWEKEFFFLRNGDEVFCLLCGYETSKKHNIQQCRSYNLKRHMKLKHKAESQLNLTERRKKATELANDYFKNNDNKNNSDDLKVKKKALEASYRVAHQIAKH